MSDYPAMGRTRIKICGVGRVEDALAAARAGVDAIGMVFDKKAGRYVAPATARAIIDSLPPFVTPVGLFVNASAVEIRQTAIELGLRHVQLHGNEDPACVADLHGWVVLKAVRVARETFAADLDQWRHALAQDPSLPLRGLVLETAASVPGGTGVANDWQFIQDCQRQGMFNGLPPLIVAGGLTPQTVGPVVRDLRPWAVDVSSGVEAIRGLKSPERIAAFVQAVRAAE